MKNIAALEKWLTKKVMRGDRGAVELRDYMRAKGKADITRRIATANVPGMNTNHSDWPGGITGRNQVAMALADEGAHTAAQKGNAVSSVGEGIPESMDALNHWYRLVKGHGWGE